MPLLRKFTTSDAVEGVVEVRMELSDGLVDYRSRVRLMLLGLFVGVILAVASMLLQAGGFVGWVFDFLDGKGEFDYLPALLGIVYTMFMVVSLALGIGIILFMGMMRRFFALLRARYGTIAGPGMGRPSKAPSAMDMARVEQEAGMLRNPARALLGLAREAEEEVPQVDLLLKYSTAFTMLLVMMGLTTGGLTILGITHVPEGARAWVTGMHLAASGFLAVTVLLLVEAQRFVHWFIARVEALEAFEGQGPLPVPAGADAMERLRASALIAGLVERPERVTGELRGTSGDLHSFDLVLGDPGERVLVRAFETVPRIDQVRELRMAAEDVANREGELPLRVVALVTADLDDLDVDEAVYDYLMEHPVLNGAEDRARSLQIVAEVEGYYSVLPFTVP